MSKMIFVNLPVANLKASMAFYGALGFKNNPQFTDDTAACMVWSETIHVMLLTHDKWRTFSTRPIPPTTSSEVSLFLSCDSRKEVDLTYETKWRGIECMLPTLQLLDITPYGRQETWEDSPAGYPQEKAGSWWRRDGRPLAQWARTNKPIE